MQGETQDVIDKCFVPFFNKCLDVQANGLPANGEEPAIKPCNLLACADMSFHKKLGGGCGGACKGTPHFSLWNEVDGDESMFRVMHGEDRCPICIRLGKEECTHLPVNSDGKIKGSPS